MKEGHPVPRPQFSVIEGGRVQETMGRQLRQDLDMYEGGLHAAVEAKFPMNAVDALLDGRQETIHMARALNVPLVAEQGKAVTLYEAPKPPAA